MLSDIDFKEKITLYIDGELSFEDKKQVHAVALKYDVDKGKAPRIMATGKGSVAEMILQVAESNKVPFYEDDTLVDILSKLDLDTEIPPELFTLVAEILAFVYQLDKLEEIQIQLYIYYYMRIHLKPHSLH